MIERKLSVPVANVDVCDDGGSAKVIAISCALLLWSISFSGFDVSVLSSTASKTQYRNVSVNCLYDCNLRDIYISPEKFVSFYWALIGRNLNLKRFALTACSPRMRHALWQNGRAPSYKVSSCGISCYVFVLRIRVYTVVSSLTVGRISFPMNRERVGRFVCLQCRQIDRRRFPQSGCRQISWRTRRYRILRRIHLFVEHTQIVFRFCSLKR